MKKKIRIQYDAGRTEELAQRIAAENPAVSMDAQMLCKFSNITACVVFVLHRLKKFAN